METSNMDTYLISENTYVMQSKLIDNRYYTTVIDKNGTFDCSKSVTRVIKASCRFHGLALERIRAQSRNFFRDGIHKLPLALAYHRNSNVPVIFFPIYSARSPGNVWFNLNAITNICSTEEDTVVTLVNGHVVSLPVQYQAFCGLYVRAFFFQKHLNQEYKTKTTISLK